MRGRQCGGMRLGSKSFENAIGYENRGVRECGEKAKSEKLNPFKRRPARQNAKEVKSRENAIGCEDSGAQIQTERKVGENASLCENSGSPECEGGEKSLQMRLVARSAAHVNAKREQSRGKCVLIKEQRATMLRRSKVLGKMPSDSRTAACEYR